MQLTLVVAMADNRAIGKNNSLPWQLPADLKRFKQLTMGHPLIMGRLTYESIGRPLPGRTSFVVTRNPNWSAEGVRVAANLDTAIGLAKEQAQRDGVNQVMIVGGADIYRQCLPLAERLYVTEIHRVIEGDAFFPELDYSAWEEVSREEIVSENEVIPSYSFVEYLRRVA